MADKLTRRRLETLHMNEIGNEDMESLSDIEMIVDLMEHIIRRLDDQEDHTHTLL
jgi:hypothetical protein